MTEQPQRRDHLDDLRAILKRIPNEPGVYRFVDGDGRVLYVGKAKALRKRVANYLRPSAQPHGRTGEMLSQARGVDWVVTASETEALLLEDNFIKEERPSYNLRLRDDKSYPSIEITLNDEWPRVRFFRGRRVPGNLYFGPFSSAKKVRETLELIGRIFPYRKCRGPEPGRPSGSPCLQYFIKRSLGPCDDRCSRDEYMGAVNQAVDFLRGRLGEVEKDIEREMRAAAEAQEFEKAALLRDRLGAVRHVHERQSMHVDERDAFDVVGLSQADPGANVQVFLVRDGAVVDRQSFYLENAVGREPADVLEEFLLEYYWEGSLIPPEVVAPLEEGAGLGAVLGERRGSRVSVKPAKRGPKRRLLELAQHNAELAAQTEVDRIARKSASRILALERLRDGLALERLPLRIECYDISNLGEQHPVGSMVVFEGGLPKKAHYRKFAVRGAAGQDDFAMMNQVLRRRFERRSEVAGGYDESFATLPDLVVVDGGKGQLSAAVSALEDAGADVDIVSLAKQREEVFVPGRRDPLPLPADDPGSLLLQRIRDEAHRFAVTYHRQRRDADLTRSSIFDELPQVGPVRRRRILEHFGSPERFLSASREEIERVPGLPRKVAREIYAHLHKAG
ncbi:MAG TPA: excinuclease ABC subunit UvrC [Thermoleophilia bacterium]|nr:excinuclease ABC subunit UvrC [Thermoleophilia bacterium]